MINKDRETNVYICITSINLPCHDRNRFHICQEKEYWLKLQSLYNRYCAALDLSARMYVKSVGLSLLQI